MRFLKLLKKYFIAHEGNEYRPHFFREANILFFSFLIVFFFAFSLVQTFVITRTDLFSAILPGILADLANNDREISGLAPLRVSSKLTFAAQAKANDMAQRGYFAHTSPNGATPWDWMKKAGYLFLYAGENLAVNFGDSSDVDAAWMNSPSHRANILNQYFAEIGIATAKGSYQGRETTFVVQMFGTPTSAIVQSSGLNLASPPSQITQEKEPKSVKGEAGKAVTEKSLAEEQFKTIVMNDTFVAVKNTNAAAEDFSPATEPTAAKYQSSWLAKIITSPQKILMTVYVILEIIITGALIAAVSKEIRKQHPLHILYGLFLLVLISGIIYGGRQTIFYQVLII